MSSPKAVHHPIFARLYPRFSRGAEERGAREHRRRLLAGLTGRVVEVGAGDGLNFPYYPAGVTELVAVEPEPHLRELAAKAAVGAPVPVKVIDGLADALPAADGEFDAAVASLVLCSVPDQARALAEIQRVLRPGGELRFYEHVIPHRPFYARLMRLADATVWPRISGGCHAARDTNAAIIAAGFTVESEERFGFAASPAMPAVPHILGTARRA